MNDIYSLNIIYVLILISQIVAFIKFIQQIIRAKNNRNSKSRAFRFIWFSIDLLAFLSIILLICIQNTDGWLPFVVFWKLLLPLNICGAVLRIEFFFNKRDKIIKERKQI